MVLRTIGINLLIRKVISLIHHFITSESVRYLQTVKQIDSSAPPPFKLRTFLKGFYCPQLCKNYIDNWWTEQIRIMSAFDASPLINIICNTFQQMYIQYLSLSNTELWWIFLLELKNVFVNFSPEFYHTICPWISVLFLLLVSLDARW